MRLTEKMTNFLYTCEADGEFMLLPHYQSVGMFRRRQYASTGDGQFSINSWLKGRHQTGEKAVSTVCDVFHNYVHLGAYQCIPLSMELTRSIHSGEQWRFTCEAISFKPLHLVYGSYICPSSEQYGWRLIRRDHGPRIPHPSAIASATFPLSRDPHTSNNHEKKSHRR